LGLLEIESKRNKTCRYCWHAAHRWAKSLPYLRLRLIASLPEVHVRAQCINDEFS
jgi:hypothetical protein